MRWEIEGRAFAAQMLPPGQIASGFFYFQTEHERPARLRHHLPERLTEAGTGKEIFYFEIPCSRAEAPPGRHPCLSNISTRRAVPRRETV